MTDLRKAAEMALEALENADFIVDMADAHYGIEPEDRLQLIEALRQALAQGEQEPVVRFNWNEAKFEWLTEYSYEKHHMKPLYLAPPSKSEKEPYGYVWTSVRDGMEVRFSRMFPNDFYKPQDIKPVYAAPPSKPWIGLTDEEIMEPWPFETRVELVRWIEAALRSKNT